MSIENKHITEFLDYFISLENPPEYAVMLQGAWGSGKTWYIKNYIESNVEYKFLKVSLYGISAYKEIEDMFYEQLNPLLTSKAAKLTGKILSGILKTTLKIDLDGNKGSSDLSTSVSVPEFVTNFDKRADDSILVFDDLERCSIKTVDILGYINQFVENYGLKVILLANEEELRKKDMQSGDAATTAYGSIKEKLIGKTFDIQADLKTALAVFLSQVRTPGLHKLLVKHSNLIENTYHTAGYQNLRHLKQSIMDFDRFHDFLPDKLDKKLGLTEHLIEMFFALSIELRKGEITPNQITHVFLMDHLARSSNSEPTAVQKISKKYRVLQTYHHPLDPAFFATFFKNGILEKITVKNAIHQSIFYLDERKPTWAKLLEYRKIEDDDFKLKLDEVYEQFEKNEIPDKYTLLHITALLLYFSSVGLLNKGVDEIKIMADNNINNLYSKGDLLPLQGETNIQDNAFGIRFFNHSAPDFQDILTKMRVTIQKAQDSDLPKKAATLLKLLKENNTSSFMEQLTIGNSRNSLYFKIPILHKIDPQDFIDAYLSLPNEDKFYFFDSLQNRYKYPEFTKELKIEEAWWLEVLKTMHSRGTSYHNTITGLSLDEAVIAIDQYVEKIKKA